MGRTFCPAHARRPLSPSSIAARDPKERFRRAAAVKAHRAYHGDWCPGWEREPHASSDLTAAHALAVANGGTESRLTVLCRSCNARQSTTPT